MTDSELLEAIESIVNRVVRSAFGSPIAQAPSLSQRVQRDHEIKAQQLAEKRARRAAKRGALN